MTPHCYLHSHFAPMPHDGALLPLPVFMVQGARGEDFEGDVLGVFGIRARLGQGGKFTEEAHGLNDIAFSREEFQGRGDYAG